MDETKSTWLQELWQKIIDFLNDPEVWLHLGGILLKIVLIYIGARIVLSIAKRTIDRIFLNRVKGPVQISEKRAKTLASLMHSAALNVIYFIAILLILAEFGIELGPLIAGAGIVGLAIGFGAQSLVKDVITGFFIIYEDQFAVGDFIETGKYSGTVIEIGLRVTKIKEWTGQVHMIPNGAIAEVTNYAKENSMAVLDIGVAYQEDIGKVETVLEEIMEKVYANEENIVSEPTIIGVQDLADSSVVIRVAAECLPMTHWGVARKLRKEIKTGFDQKGIEIPYPQLVTYRREE